MHTPIFGPFEVFRTIHHTLQHASNLDEFITDSFDFIHFHVVTIHTYSKPMFRFVFLAIRIR